MNTYKKVEKGFKEYDNWRYLSIKPELRTKEFRESGLKGHVLTDEKLVVLLGNYFYVGIPKMTISKFLNTDFSDELMITPEGPYPSYCKSCCGAGKFDWVTDITKPNPFTSRFEFIRDKSIVLLHRKKNGQFLNDALWAPTEVNEGERICDDCLGTGITLAKHTMGNMDRYGDCDAHPSRYSLVPCDIRYFL